MSISIITCMDRNRLIGKDNKLPWDYKEDLKFFKKMTSGKKILMGQATFDSIMEYNNGNLLPGRKHVLATLDLPEEKCDELREKGVDVTHSLHDYLMSQAHEEELVVIGGMSIYNQALQYADTLYVTLIDKEFEGDAWFPEIDREEWQLFDYQHGETPELIFCTYKRAGSYKPLKDLKEAKIDLMDWLIYDVKEIASLMSACNINPEIHPISHEILGVIQRNMQENVNRYIEEYPMINKLDISNTPALDEYRDLMLEYAKPSIHWTAEQLLLHIIKIVDKFVVAVQAHAEHLIAGRQELLAAATN